jgi:hypothetical protein
VAPSYVDACDSLGVAAVQQGELLKEAKDDYTDLIDLMNYEVVLRDSMIEAQQKSRAEFQADFNAQTHFFQLAIKQGKPRTKVYAGISALGNNEHPFGGGEINFTLVNKKDKAFDVGTGFIGNAWYVRVGYKNKLSFKK